MSAALRVGGCEVLGLGALTPCSSWGLQPGGSPGGVAGAGGGIGRAELALAELAQCGSWER